MKQIPAFLFLLLITIFTLLFVVLIFRTSSVTGQGDTSNKILPLVFKNQADAEASLPASLGRENLDLQPSAEGGTAQVFEDTPSVLIDSFSDQPLAKGPVDHDMDEPAANLVDLSHPPDPPTLIIPADGAEPVHLRGQDSVDLQALLSAPDSRELTASFYGRPACVGSNFTLAVLPDTQYYASETNNGTREMFDSQTQWIVDNREAWNIAYVTHVGDIVDYAADTAQWDIAGSLDDPIGALTRLDNAGIPYGLTIGNHDGGPNDTGNFNAYFPIGRVGDGHYGDDNDNNYGLFTAGGMDFIILHLEYGVDEDVLAWANDLLSNQFSDRRAIVVTHDLLDDYVNPAPFSDKGSAIFEALKHNRNLFLMLGGHLIGGFSRTDVVDGHTIYSLRSDYQNDGGHGWLRLMEFQPATDQIQVYTYSPYMDEWQSDGSNFFTLDYDMTDTSCAPFELIDTVEGLKSGSNTLISWPNRSIGTQYLWYVSVSDGVNVTDSPVRAFTTAEGPYMPLSVSIDGPKTGLMRHTSTFTATVGSGDVATPLTYLWSTNGQPVITHQNTLSDRMDYKWTSHGPQRITLIAFNHESSATVEYAVDVYRPVYANFSFSPLGRLAPFVITFTNRSIGDFDTCHWDFGDGATSTICKARTHIFPNKGTYRVTLTVSGPGGTASLARIINTANPRMVETRTYLPFVTVQVADDKR